jgi:phenylpyruvate tautomerase PptA (4-oxalocrotonate tautomerase family)
MPMIDITAPKGALAAPVRDVLVKRLTDCLLKWEGAAPNNAAAQAIAWVYVHEIETENFYVGGTNPKEPRFRFEVTTPEGALDDDRRAGLVKEVGTIVEDALGAAGAGLNHWVHFREIDEGGWGAAGRIFRHKDIVAFARGQGR